MDSYSETLPPIWAVCEVMSLGTLSHWYSNLQPSATRRAIADIYDIDQSVLQSWLHHLSLIRNICAHHARLWNREFAILPMRPRTRPAHLSAEFRTGSRRIYNSLLILLHFMDTISPGHRWRQRLMALTAEHSVPISAMDFPAHWRDSPLWQR